MAKKLNTREPGEIAPDLEAAEMRVDEVKVDFLEPAEDALNDLRDEMQASMTERGIATFRLKDGVNRYTRAFRKTYKVIDTFKDKAFAWAQENYPAVIDINGPKLNKVLKPMLDSELPDFVTVSETEYLQVRQSGEGEEN